MLLIIAQERKCIFAGVMMEQEKSNGIVVTLGSILDVLQ